MSAEGHTYGGRYAVIERVGSGGMAEVYRARDELLGREVAVKVLSERFASDKAFIDRFRREAQLAANLNHPNIVSLFDFGADDRAHFIVMEFIDGKALGDIIREEGPLLPERSAEIASDVAKALARAHGAGLIHRDIKPSNIMITKAGQTKVTDFGIARALTRDGEQTVTQTGMVIGTAAYLSPEQAQGSPLDVRSDIYSMGCVLYEMLAGRPPFTGDTPLAIAYKHVRENPVPPSRINPDVPKSLDALVLKAMAKNPDNRYHTAEEMDADLQRFLAGQKVHATPLLADRTMVSERATGTQMMSEVDYGPARRSAAWYVVIALAVLALFAGLAWLLASNLLGGKQVEVPEVVGLQENDAISKLSRAGFEFETEEKPSKRPEGEVTAQDPEGGDDADEGSTVVITVSAGPRQSVVPDLEGLTLEEAEQELRDAKLKLGEVTTEPSEDIEEDLVIRSIPASGDEVESNTEVDLVLSAGPEPVVVPFVVGETEEQARAEIGGAGLEVEVTTAPGDEAAGTVIAQDPEGGTEASPGDTVRITVSEGPTEREMPDVVGMDADDAETLLEQDFELDVSQVEEACSTQPPGAVCRQEPEPGAPVSSGDPATLFVQPGFGWLGQGWEIAFLSLFSYLA